MLYIGIDLGTSASKFLLVDEVGRVLNTVTKEYPLSFPRPGWSEQDPAHWWQACLAGVPELLAGFDAKQVAGIGVGGQMHGLVALDAAGNVLRPAILWNDGRTAAQVDYLNETVGPVCPHRQNPAAQRLPGLPADRRARHRLFRRFRHPAAGRGAQAVERRDAGPLRRDRGPDARPV